MYLYVCEWEDVLVDEKRYQIGQKVPIGQNCIIEIFVAIDQNYSLSLMICFTPILSDIAHTEH